MPPMRKSRREAKPTERLKKFLIKVVAAKVAESVLNKKPPNKAVNEAKKIVAKAKLLKNTQTTKRAAESEGIKGKAVQKPIKKAVTKSPGVLKKPLRSGGVPVPVKKPQKKVVLVNHNSQNKGNSKGQPPVLGKNKSVKVETQRKVALNKAVKRKQGNMADGEDKRDKADKGEEPPKKVPNSVSEKTESGDESSSQEAKNLAADDDEAKKPAETPDKPVNPPRRRGRPSKQAKAAQLAAAAAAGETIVSKSSAKANDDSKGGDGAEPRRSKRQPKPSERMKAYLSLNEGSDNEEEESRVPTKIVYKAPKELSLKSQAVSLRSPNALLPRAFTNQRPSPRLLHRPTLVSRASKMNVKGPRMAGVIQHPKPYYSSNVLHNRSYKSKMSSSGSPMKLTSASYRARQKLLSSVPPIVIKVRTTPIGSKLNKRKNEMIYSQPIKVIKVDTGMGHSESSDDDTAEENDDTKAGDFDVFAACDRAMESLRSKIQAWGSEPNHDLNPKSSQVDKSTVDKFIRLSSAITDGLREAVKEKGELQLTISPSSNLLDILKSTEVKGLDEALSKDEADRLLTWLHVEQEEGKSKSPSQECITASIPEDASGHMALYSQLLQMLVQSA